MYDVCSSIQHSPRLTHSQRRGRTWLASYSNSLFTMLVHGYVDRHGHELIKNVELFEKIHVDYVTNKGK